MVHRTNNSEETLNMDKKIGENLTIVAYPRNSLQISVSNPKVFRFFVSLYKFKANQYEIFEDFFALHRNVCALW